MAEIKSKPNRKPSIKQKKALDILVGNGGNITQAMLEAGYSVATANTPQKLTDSKGWQELMAEHLSDDAVTQRHKELLNSTTLDHQVFALGPKDEKDKLSYIEADKAKALKDGKEYREIEYVTDEDIRQMFEDINCKVRRIVHRETARDVYFWVADNRSRKDAIDMAYKLKGSYAPEKSIVANINLNADKEQRARELIRGILGNRKDTR